MSFPAGLTLITVAYRFDLPPSGGATGRVRFTAPYPLVGTTDNSVVPPFTTMGALAADGTGSVALPATNDPQWTPVNWAYTVVAKVGGATIEGTLQLDYQTTSVQLADLLQVDGTAVPGSSYIPLSLVGAASGVATLDSAALLPATQQTAGWASSPRLPQWAQPSSIVTQLQSGHGWTGNAQGTLTTDTSDSSIGTQSVQIQTLGNGLQATLSRTGMSSIDATGKAIRLRFKVVDMTNLAEIGFIIGSSNFTNFYKWPIWLTGASKPFQSGDWVVITLSWHDAAVTGSPNRAALTDGRFYAIDNAGGTVQVKWQSMELVPDGSTTWPKGVITLAVDDSYASQWTLFKPMIDAYGYPATAFTITDYVGTNGRLTLPQLKIMQDKCGWEIAAHAYTAVDHAASFNGITAAQLVADLRQQRMWLNSNGFRGSDGLAYPLGQFGLTSDGQPIDDIIRDLFFYARTTAGRTHETPIPADRLRIRAQSGISSFAGGTAPATILSDITKIAANCSWGIFVFHDIVAGAPASTTQCQSSDVASILAAIAAAGIPVRTMGDVLRTGGS